MANDIIYNPLLKRGLQELGDTAAQEAEIEDLRQKKVTKFFAATDTLEPGEIAQYQGDDDSVNGLVNGYFYKKTSTPIILPAGTQCFDNGQSAVNLNGYNVTLGWYYITEDITPAAGNTFFNYRIRYYQGFSDYLFFGTAFPAVGDTVFNRNTKTLLSVTDVNENLEITVSDGTVIDPSDLTSGNVYKLYTFINEDGNYFTIANCSPMQVWVFLHYTISGSTFNVVDWFTIPYANLITTLSPTTIGSNAFQQVNAQPAQTQVIIRQWTTE